MNPDNSEAKSKLFNEIYSQFGEKFMQLNSYNLTMQSRLLSYTIDNCEFYINPETHNKYTYNKALQWWNRGIINYTDTKGSFERVE